MDTATLTDATFKLYKVTDRTPSWPNMWTGEWVGVDLTRITDVTVTPSSDGKQATLNPYGGSKKLLARGTWYEARVTTFALDLAGNGLDEVICGYVQCTRLQPKVWYFKTGR